MMSTRQLIDVLEKHLVPFGLSEDLQRLAFKNKVLLEFLTILNIGGSVRVEQETRLSQTIVAARVLARCLDGLNYAFFKFVKPVKYAPADIDLIVGMEDSFSVVKRIESLGYRVVVAEPYCATLVKGVSIVDVYVHPTIGGIVYLDGAKLLRHVQTVEFNGFKIPVLEPYVEAVVACAHAVYKEKLFTLNDYFTVRNFVTLKSRKLAKELNCQYAIDFVLSLNNKIENNLLSMPYSFPAPLWFTVLLQKVFSDNLTRATCPKILQALADKRAGTQITSKLTRETY